MFISAWKGILKQASTSATAKKKALKKRVKQACLNCIEKGKRGRQIAMSDSSPSVIRKHLERHHEGEGLSVNDARRFMADFDSPKVTALLNEAGPSSTDPPEQAVPDAAESAVNDAAAESAIADAAESAVDDEAESAVADAAESALNDAAEQALDDAAEPAVDDESEQALNDAAEMFNVEEEEVVAPICPQTNITNYFRTIEDPRVPATLDQTSFQDSVIKKLDEILKNQEEERKKPVTDSPMVTDRPERENISKIDQCESLSDVLDTGLFNSSEQLDGSLMMQCSVCQEFLNEHPPNAASTKNSLSRGLFIEKNRKELLFRGANQAWYSFKNNLVNHIILASEASIHKPAQEFNSLKKNQQTRGMTVMTTLVGMTVMLIKTKCSGQAYEDFVLFLASRGLDLGDQSHGR